MLREVLLSCENINNQVRIDDTATIDRNVVEKKMQVKFNAAIENILCRITLLVQQNGSESSLETTVDKGKYNSPDSSATNICQLQRTCTDRFDELCEALGDRNLVIHVDDCQLFFKGVLHKKV